MKFIQLETSEYLAVSEIKMLWAEPRIIAQISVSFIYIIDKQKNTYIYDRYETIESAILALKNLIDEIENGKRWD